MSSLSNDGKNCNLTGGDKFRHQEDRTSHSIALADEDDGPLDENFTAKGRMHGGSMDKKSIIKTHGRSRKRLLENKCLDPILP